MNLSPLRRVVVDVDARFCTSVRTNGAGPGIMSAIFREAVHCAAVYDAQQNIHMNDHADSPFVLLSWNARKCICIMQRLIGVMGDVITASAAHYLLSAHAARASERPNEQARARARLCYESERMYRVNIMRPVICQPQGTATYFLSLVLKVFIPVAR